MEISDKFYRVAVAVVAAATTSAAEVALSGNLTLTSSLGVLTATFIGVSAGQRIAARRCPKSSMPPTTEIS